MLTGQHFAAHFADTFGVVTGWEFCCAILCMKSLPQKSRMASALKFHISLH